MPSAQRSITINRPIDDVFAYVADGENSSRWRSDKIEVKHESGSGVGAIYRQTVPGPMGRRVKADYELTAHEPPKRSEFKAIAGPVRPTGSYVLTTAGEGKTKLTFSLDAKLGLVKRLLMGRSVQKSMDAEMLALDKLKQVLEAQPAKAASTASTATTAVSAKTATKAGPKPTSRRSPKKKPPASG
jgi:uncharacterized membrane protein